MADRTVSVEFVARHAGFTSGVQAMRRDVVDLRSQIAQSARQNAADWQALGRAAVVAGGTMAAGLGAAVVSFHSFQTEMNRVGALTGATGDEFVQLGDLAQELGRTTAYTASQSADALGFLAMAGFDANTAMEALPQTLTLAAAAGMDLAQAADLTTNILTGFGLETSELARANDALVATFTGSNTSMQQLGDAMRYAGPLASAAGIEFEEAAAAIGLMGNAGIQGSMAGTSLRGALTRLLNPTAQVQSTLDRLGITTRDSSGEILSLADLVDQLGTSGADAGELMEIFGQRAGPAMTALLSQGADELRTFTQDLRESGGIAEDIADRQLEGLHGSLTRFRSAAEGAAIALGEGLAPAIGLAADIGGQLLQWFGALPGPMQKFISMGAAATAGVTLFGGAALIAIPRLVALHDAFLRMTRATTTLAGVKSMLASVQVGSYLAWSNLVAMINPTTIAIGAAAAASAGLIWWLTRMDSEQQTVAASAETLADSLGLAYNDLSTSAVEAGDEVADTAQRFYAANSELIDQLRELEDQAAMDHLIQVGWQLTMRGSTAEEAFGAVQRLADQAGIDLPVEFDATVFEDAQSYIDRIGERLDYAADAASFWAAGMTNELAAVGQEAAHLFSEGQMASGLQTLAAAQEHVESLGLNSGETRRRIQAMMQAFGEGTGIDVGNLADLEELLYGIYEGSIQAAPGMQELAGALLELGDGELQLSSFDQLPDRLREIAAEGGPSADAMLDLADELDEVAASAEQSASALDTYLDRVRRATDPVYALTAALDDVETAQKAYDDAVDEHGKSSKEAEQAAFAHLQALDAVEAAAISGELSFEAFTARLDAMVDSEKLSADQARVMRDRVAELIELRPGFTGEWEAHLLANPDQAQQVLGDIWNAYLSLPSEVRTDLDAADNASDIVEVLGDRYLELPEQLRAYLEATDDASAVVAFLQGRYDDLPESIQTVLRATDAATSVIDRVRQNLRDLDGMQAFVNVIARGADIAGVNSYGGHVQHDGGLSGTGPRHARRLGPREVPVIAEQGEFWVNRHATAKHLPLLEAINADRFHTGGTVGALSAGRSSYDLGALWGVTRGASFGTATEHLRAIERLRDLYQQMTREIEEQERAERRASLVAQRRAADTADERRRLTEQIREHDRETDLAAQRRRIEDRIAAAEANQRIAANREAYEFDRMAAGDQLRWLEQRLAAERRYTDDWMRLADQRRQILEREASAARQAAADAQRHADDQLATVNRLLDEMQAAHDRYEQARAAARDRAADAEQTAIARRHDELMRQLSLDQGDDPWDWSAETIAAQARAQAEQVVAYEQAIADARARGVSDDALAALGIDGPEALGQLQVLLAASDDALADMSAAIAERTATIARQVEREMGQAHTELGREIAEINDQLADDLAAAAAELSGDLATIGYDGGRDWADAIAEGLRSGIPVVEQAARQLQDAVRAAKEADAAASQAERAATARTPTVADQIEAIWRDVGVALAYGSESHAQRRDRLARAVQAGDRTLADLRRSAEIQAIQHPHTRLPSYHQGGTVPGPVGREQLALVLGGETYRTPPQEAALQAQLGQTVVIETVREVLPDGLSIRLADGTLGEVVLGTIVDAQRDERDRQTRIASRRVAARGGRRG